MKIKTLTHKDAEWPKELSSSEPAVSQLYVSGSLPQGPRLGVVGTRRPTAYGTEVTRALVEPLAERSVPIVSGLAIGIDSIAHTAALEAGGQTIAVLPSALSKPYPARHQHLAKTIAERGAVVSEYQSEAIHKGQFIARNRIVAALSDVLLVVEATHKSGTLHTVNYALELDKEVAAVPGPIGALNSQGTNKLLQMGAHVVTEVSDLCVLLGVDPRRQTEPDLGREEKLLYDALGSEPQTTTMLSQRLNLPQARIRVVLTGLEIQKLVARRADGMYARR